MLKTSGFDQLSQVASYRLQLKLLKYCISIIYILINIVITVMIRYI